MRLGSARISIVQFYALKMGFNLMSACLAKLVQSAVLTLPALYISPSLYLVPGANGGRRQDIIDGHRPPASHRQQTSRARLGQDKVF